jgi:hypothetical protein
MLRWKTLVFPDELHGLLLHPFQLKVCTRAFLAGG